MLEQRDDEMSSTSLARKPYEADPRLDEDIWAVAVFHHYANIFPLNLLLRTVFLYPLVNELAICVRPASASVNLTKAVMNTLRPNVLEYVVEGEVMDTGIEREPVKYLAVIRY